MWSVNNVNRLLSYSCSAWTCRTLGWYSHQEEWWNMVAECVTISIIPRFTLLSCHSPRCIPSFMPRKGHTFMCVPRVWPGDHWLTRWMNTGCSLFFSSNLKEQVHCAIGQEWAEGQGKQSVLIWNEVSLCVSSHRVFNSSTVCLCSLDFWQMFSFLNL